jgi:hypothetical protein
MDPGLKDKMISCLVWECDVPCFFCFGLEISVDGLIPSFVLVKQTRYGIVDDNICGARNVHVGHVWSLVP